MGEEPNTKVARLEVENARLRAEMHSLRQALEREDEVAAVNEVRLRLAYFSTIQALVQAIEAKDPYTIGHSQMVAKIAVALARRLELTDDECERVRIAGLLLDVGKIGISGEILTKKEGLTAAERQVLETHVEIGAQIVEPIIYPWDVSTLVYQHHERLDGSGYPARLRGADIAFEARILGLADAFVAMIVRRAYREAHGEPQALAYFRSEAGRTFDASCVEALAAVLESESELRDEIDRFKASI